MTETSRPTGLELILRGVPYGMSENALKKTVAPLLEIKYDFLVVFKKYSEELFWESLSDTNVSNTARLIIPDADTQHTFNPGERLLVKNPKFSIKYKGKDFYLEVTSAQNNETTNARFEELRKTETTFKPTVKAVSDGVLGDICRVSCGNFDDENCFESVYDWAPNPESNFNKFNYYGDAFPKKFQVSLTDSAPKEPRKLEWMDLHESNIRGMIFEKKNDSDNAVYFAVDKPPQFYEQTETGNIQVGNAERRKIFTRTSYPSSMTYCDGFSDVAGVPWVIQYSRVFRIIYRERQNFTISSYEPRLSQRRKDALIAFHHNDVETSLRKKPQILQTLQNTMMDTRDKFRPQLCHDCHLAVLKLFYNCNICPFLEEAIVALFLMLKTVDRALSSTGLSDHPWPLRFRRDFCDALRGSSQSMETSHLRAIRRLYASSSSGPKMSKTKVTAAERPESALVRHLGPMIDSFFTKSLRSIPPAVFEVLVYPSHVEIRGPSAVGMNSVIELHEEKIDRFLRVKFVENDEEPFKTEASINPDSILISADSVLDNRVVPILLNKLQLLRLRPINQRFEFLGYSVSSLKKRKAVWFFLADPDHDDLTAEKIRTTIGNWDSKDELAKKIAKHPSKWGARVALAFTQSSYVAELLLHEWAGRKDEGSDPNFPNTDGCGLISPKLCGTINQKLSLLGFKVYSQVIRSMRSRNSD